MAIVNSTTTLASSGSIQYRLCRDRPPNEAYKLGVNYSSTLSPTDRKGRPRDARFLNQSARPPRRRHLAERLSQARGRIQDELRKIIVGQDAVSEQVSGGAPGRRNGLIVGVPVWPRRPGAFLARALDLKFYRIHFTPT